MPRVKVIQDAKRGHCNYSLGETVIYDPGETSGSEIQKKRPAIVISSGFKFHGQNDCLHFIIPLSTKLHRAFIPFIVEIKQDFLKENPRMCCVFN